jgi:hypothetical protein
VLYNPEDVLPSLLEGDLFYKKLSAESSNTDDNQRCAELAVANENGIDLSSSVSQSDSLQLFLWNVTDADSGPKFAEFVFGLLRVQITGPPRVWQYSDYLQVHRYGTRTAVRTQIESDHDHHDGHQCVHEYTTVTSTRYGGYRPSWWGGTSVEEVLRKKHDVQTKSEESGCGDSSSVDAAQKEVLNRLEEADKALRTGTENAKTELMLAAFEKPFREELGKSLDAEISRRLEAPTSELRQLYEALHANRLIEYFLENQKSKKLLVYRCSSMGFCGGHGDRMNGLLSLFLLALVTKRVRYGN